MTTKSEPSAFAADSAVAPGPAEAAEAAIAAAPDAPLPSIIVDPQALAPVIDAIAAATPAAGPEPPLAAPSNGTRTEVGSTTRADDAARGNGAGAVELSDFEAEHFATSYRASWEPGEHLDAVMLAPAAAAATVESVSEANSKRPIAAEPIVLPGHARTRGLALTAIAFAAFAALVALALSSTRGPSVPPQAAAPEPAAVPLPVVPRAPGIAQAEPIPQPTAIAPSEPTATELATAAGAAAAAGAGGSMVEPLPAVEPLVAAPVEPIAPVEPVVAPPPPRVETVRIRIVTSPKDATLMIDGSAVPNPYDLLVPKGDKHRITASAPGYESSDQLVGFERKRDLALRLKQVRAPRPEPAPIAKPTPRPARKTPAATAKHPAPAPARKGAAFVSESPY